MSKRSATKMCLEPSNTADVRPDGFRSPKRARLNNSPPATDRLNNYPQNLESSTSPVSARRRKRASSEGARTVGVIDINPLPYKRQRLGDTTRRNIPNEAPVGATAAGNESMWNRDCEAASYILESVMKLSEQDRAVNDALYNYEIIDTSTEGTKYYGSVDWKFEQLEFKKLQLDAIRLLIDPKKRHHPEVGLNGCLRTPVRYWAKRLETKRLIRLGLSPWHLESLGEVCGFRVPGRYIRPPHGHPPVIPIEYYESHINTLAAFLKDMERAPSQKSQGDIAAQLSEEMKWLKATDRAREEYLDIDHQQPASAPDKVGRSATRNRGIF